MNIGYRKSDDIRHPRPLFVVISQFDTDSFPVRVRYFRLGKTKVSKTASEISRLERRKIPARQRPGKMNPAEGASHLYREPSILREERGHACPPQLRRQHQGGQECPRSDNGGMRPPP